MNITELYLALSLIANLFFILYGWYRYERFVSDYRMLESQNEKYRDRFEQEERLDAEIERNIKTYVFERDSLDWTIAMQTMNRIGQNVRDKSQWVFEATPEQVDNWYNQMVK
jgi:hypothetical protein